MDVIIQQANPHWFGLYQRSSNLSWIVVNMNKSLPTLKRLGLKEIVDSSRWLLSTLLLWPVSSLCALFWVQRWVIRTYNLPISLVRWSLRLFLDCGKPFWGSFWVGIYLKNIPSCPTSKVSKRQAHQSRPKPDERNAGRPLPRRKARRRCHGVVVLGPWDWNPVGETVVPVDGKSGELTSGGW